MAEAVVVAEAVAEAVVVAEAEEVAVVEEAVEEAVVVAVVVAVAEAAVVQVVQSKLLSNHTDILVRRILCIRATRCAYHYAMVFMHTVLSTLSDTVAYLFFFSN